MKVMPVQHITDRKTHTYMINRKINKKGGQDFQEQLLKALGNKSKLNRMYV
ncbi:hypothetical protein [Brevibacillus laterosporus]|uniref:hypothetical protein n=1 Tax=Brevibacillus laterosporus TaxID=1465 RepID=UPI002E1AA1A3|nr:hypothetical protein [Brevibacillus laterosporus]MED1667241.1 hypothetical protein [Brevibacillus laterosporus]MED1719691.1 hypothetical protein [Brevibacillus laterosporus]